jgi:drug/metabolite transporter (DMT)-like permease
MMLAVFLFSSMDTLAKLVLKSYPLPGLIWARYAVHMVFIVILAAPHMGMKLLRTQRLGLQAGRGLLLVLSTGFFYLSLRHLPLAETAAISFVAPLFVTILSGPLLKEKVLARQWTAVVLGFLGVLVIMRPGGGLLRLETVYPVITALLFSLYQILTRKLAGREHPLTTLFYTGLVGSIITSVALPFHWVTPSLWQALLMTAVGVLGASGHLFLIRAAEHASPSVLAPFSYTQLVWSTLLAFIAFGDLPDHISMMGMAIIILAGMLAVNWQRALQMAADSSRKR